VSGTLAGVRAVILDVDGVLLDARPSYHAVAEEAARRAVATVLGAERARALPFERDREIAAFKAAGRFNDDWETARGIALLLLLRAAGKAPPLGDFLAAARGQGVLGLFSQWPEYDRTLSQETISRTCCALYAGDQCRALFGFDAGEALRDAPARGAWENEVLLPEPRLLEAVSRRFPLALYTGRNPGEAKLAMRLCRLEIPEAMLWVADGRPKKPDPAGLLWLTHVLLRGTPRGAQVLFIGDTADDQAASRAAQDRGAPLIYAHIERPGDTSRVLSRLLVDAAGVKE
jgi:phosphoglycolate phosphatase-like HAD superfamily hydrolase